MSAHPAVPADLPLAPARTAAIVQAYAAIARPYILQFFPAPNSCISACRTTIEVLELFGVRAWALPCRMKAELPALHLAYASGLNDRDLAIARRRLQGRMRSVGRDPETWQGHLAVATEHHWFLDPTFDSIFWGLAHCGYQAHEEPQIFCAPTGSELDPEAFGLDFQATLGNGDLLEVRYYASSNHGYREQPAWETDHLQYLIHRIAGQLTGTVPRSVAVRSGATLQP